MEKVSGEGDPGFKVWIAEGEETEREGVTLVSWLEVVGKEAVSSREDDDDVKEGKVEIPKESPGKMVSADDSSKFPSNDLEGGLNGGRGFDGVVIELDCLSTDVVRVVLCELTRSVSFKGTVVVLMTATVTSVGETISKVEMDLLKCWSKEIVVEVVVKGCVDRKGDVVEGRREDVTFEVLEVKFDEASGEMEARGGRAGIPPSVIVTT